MPMDLSRYPKNWKAIALAVKEAANWTCRECGTDCFKPGDICGDRSLRAVYTLAVHHADCNPENNRSDNLIPLCSRYHLKKHRGGKRNISPGQLSLF